MSERLIRVTSFSELRAGMIVVLMGCEACGAARCRGMCLSMLPPDDEYLYPSWEVIPPCHLNPGEDCNTISAKDVADGAVFRVLDGLEEPSTETAAARTKETADVLRR